MTTDRKVALVFGGSRGIGAASVARLARDGFAVAFTYVTQEEKAATLARGVESAGGQALALRADSADPRQIREAVAATVAGFGAIDVVVVNAGLLRIGTIDKVTLDELDLMLDVNVRGVYLAIQAALPHMRDGGRVVTIGSNAAVSVRVPGASVYALTKAAVAGMVKGLAHDLAPRKITVNNLQPGPTDTDMNTGALDALARMSPLQRVAHADEIAGLLAYVVREEAAYMTGASLTIDGGFAL